MRPCGALFLCVQRKVLMKRNYWHASAVMLVVLLDLAIWAWVLTQVFK